MKKSNRARFSKKKSVSAIFDFLGSKWPKIKVFATLWENGSNDFAHFAYLDRSHHYLQLFYWHQVLEKSFWAFRGHFRWTFWVFSKKSFWKIEKFSKKFFFSIFRFFSFWVEKCKKFFFPLWGQVIWDLEFFTKKSKIESFRLLSHFSRVWVTGSVR